MSYAGNIDTDGVTHLIGSTLLGSCSTLAATADKVVSLADFDALLPGVTVQVKFLYSNTAASPTLNVNNTGAKPIYVRGVESPGTTAATSWDANSVVSFTYDGTSWMMNDANVALTEIVGDGVLTGFTATNLTGAANELKGETTEVKNTLNHLAIPQTGNEATQAIPVNGVIYLTSNTAGLSDGYYRNKSGAVISAGATFTISNLEPQTNGALSAVYTKLMGNIPATNLYNSGDVYVLRFNGYTSSEADFLSAFSAHLPAEEMNAVCWDYSSQSYYMVAWKDSFFRVYNSTLTQVYSYTLFGELVWIKPQ